MCDWDKYRRIISNVIPFAAAVKAVELAATPGATDKVVVTFE